MLTIFILNPPPPVQCWHNSTAACPKHRYHLNNIELGGVGGGGKLIYTNTTNMTYDRSCVSTILSKIESWTKLVETRWNFEDKIRVPFSTDLNAHNFYSKPPLPQFNVDIIRQPHVRSIGIISTTLNWGVWGGGGNWFIQTLRIWHMIAHVSQQFCPRL